MLAVIIPVLVVIVVVVIINAIRPKKPKWLPQTIRSNWDVLPRPLRSLGWYDDLFSRKGGKDRALQQPEAPAGNESTDIGYETLATGKELLNVGKASPSVAARYGSIDVRLGDFELPNVIVQ